MVKLAKYLKSSAGFVALIVGLLFLQAYCDLELPDYTSRIVNEGIQQSGIEDGVPEKMREQTAQSLELFLDEDARQLLEKSYAQEDGRYVLKDLSDKERKELGTVLEKAELVTGVLMQMDGQEAAAMMQGANAPDMGNMPAADMQDMSALDMVKAMPKEQRAQVAEAISGQFEDMPDTMTAQYAVQFVKQEYEALGEDLGDLQIRYIMKTGGAMLLLAMIAMLASVAVTFCSARVAAAVAHDLRNDVYRKVIGFTSEEFNHFSTASLITRSTNDIQQIQMFLAMGFRLILYSPILGLGGVLRVLHSDVSMSWIIGLAVVLIMLVIAVLFKVAMPRFTKLQTLIDRVNLVTREILSGIMVTRAFSAEKHEEERFEEANRNLMKTNLFVNRCMTFMMPIMMLIMNGVSVLIIYSGAHAIDAGTLQVGDMMAFIQYAMQIIMSFLMITMMSILIPRANVAGKRIYEVLNTQSTICDPQTPQTPDADVRGVVEFDHVSFSYPDADEKVLEDISFKAERGQTVAFIGSTGSGKSTLINLIPRFFDVTQGAVRVDGVDVRDMTKEDLCARLGYVPQKSILFSGTIDSNIRYGRTQASEEEVRAAAEIAQASDFIEEKEEQYDSPIAQGGTNVSGGQKQRLSIARAIAKKPEILIFDDSFSALDYKTDVALRRALKESTKDITTLIVAQRISTILHADQIIVLDEGKMAGKGTHEELMKNCEVYRQIATSQLSEEELAG
ncbi:ABC transporter ATP-binding protein [Parablautia sp. Marseille-Q6255]|uniref:ABC transporter ATP-binding protein n=1 Tax=Parablautia sp. Marseille-Q6255 TaxID=3039593 RepID=UPI0024BCC6E9|nr:ABC transporter ATP-binding protein [Parablautia sp. Marseille-Q6255]